MCDVLLSLIVFAWISTDEDDSSNGSALHLLHSLLDAPECGEVNSTNLVWD